MTWPDYLKLSLNQSTAFLVWMSDTVLQKSWCIHSYAVSLQEREQCVSEIADTWIWIKWSKIKSGLLTLANSLVWHSIAVSPCHTAWPGLSEPASLSEPHLIWLYWTWFTWCACRFWWISAVIVSVMNTGLNIQTLDRTHCTVALLECSVWAIYVNLGCLTTCVLM